MKANKNHTTRISLEKLDKKQVFSVPNNYFESLPSIIQNKAIGSTRKKLYWQRSGALKIALPLVLIVLIAGFWAYKLQSVNVNSDANIAAMLDEVSSTELVAYIEETDMTTDEILSIVSFDNEQLNDLTYGIDDLSDEDLDVIIDDINLDDI